MQGGGFNNCLITARGAGNIALCLTHTKGKGHLSTLQSLEGSSAFLNYCICLLVAVT